MESEREREVERAFDGFIDARAVSALIMQTILIRVIAFG